MEIIVNSPSFGKRTPQPKALWRGVSSFFKRLYPESTPQEISEFFKTADRFRMPASRQVGRTHFPATLPKPLVRDTFVPVKLPAPPKENFIGGSKIENWSAEAQSELNRIAQKIDRNNAAAKTVHYLATDQRKLMEKKLLNATMADLKVVTEHIAQQKRSSGFAEISEWLRKESFANKGFANTQVKDFFRIAKGVNWPPEVKEHYASFAKYCVNGKNTTLADFVHAAIHGVPEKAATKQPSVAEQWNTMWNYRQNFERPVESFIGKIVKTLGLSSKPPV